jgi:hypothetical protein
MVGKDILHILFINVICSATKDFALLSSDKSELGIRETKSFDYSSSHNIARLIKAIKIFKFKVENAVFWQPC